MDANDERLRATCALWAGGFVRRQRHAVTNQPTRPRARDAAGALQAALAPELAKMIDRPALTPRPDRPPRQRCRACGPLPLAKDFGTKSVWTTAAEEGAGSSGIGVGRRKGST